MFEHVNEVAEELPAVATDEDVRVTWRELLVLQYYRISWITGLQDYRITGIVVIGNRPSP